jgi:prophage antirepressor-like protein
LIYDTMNIIPHTFAGHHVRSIERDGALWFIAQDVFEILQLRNGPAAVARLDEDERDSIAISDVTPGTSKRLVVNESGLYALTLRSRKPEAKAFRKWVTSELLPTIHRTGAYGTSQGARVAFDALRIQYEAADREVEHRTRHDHYRSGNSRALEHIAAVVEDVAARRGLNPAAVGRAQQANVQHVMAEFFQDPYAITCIEKDRLRLEAERHQRAAQLAAIKPRTRRR